MSLQYNDLTNYKGIIQIYEKEAGYNRGDVSGNTDNLKEATADMNLAMDTFQNIAVKASRTWAIGDSNHTKYSIIFFNLVANQRDYAFTTDEQGNLITDIYRVAVANSSGVYNEVNPVDQQSANSNFTNTDSFIDGRNTTGTPTRYDKTDNGIFLDPIPNYSYGDGIKLLVNREASYFTHSDTTKKPGVHGTLHEYFPLKMALARARRNNLSNYNTLAAEVMKYEGDDSRRIVGMIAQVYGQREKDMKGRLIANRESSK